ncbi:LysR substrate-binding domain-containing protein [Nocardia fluminea]|uniref:LysR substrate-binding domain-containing protein n=1 Tax=Nocardia fluminea TaxID=134984 RepID=UPI00365DB663
MLVTHSFVTDLPNETVFHDDWVVVTDRNHEPAGGELSTEDLQRRPWGLVYHSQTASTPALRRLRMLGIEPTRQIVTENFLTVRCLITGSDRIALVPRRLLTVPGMSQSLTAYPRPVDLGELTQRTNAPEKIRPRAAEPHATNIATSRPTQILYLSRHRSLGS